MCLTINTRYHKRGKDGIYKPLIATEDIPVWKRFRTYYQWFESKTSKHKLRGYIHDKFVYERGKNLVYYQVGKRKFSFNGPNNENVHVGLHSMKGYLRDKSSSQMIFLQCYIPKGAQYYRGYYKEIVSDQLWIP